MSLTPEQREAAIQKMCHGMSGGLVGPPYHRLTISDANAALNALLENHVVLHRDDARAVQTFLDAYDAYMVGSVSRRTFGPMVEARRALAALGLDEPPTEEEGEVEWRRRVMGEAKDALACGDGEAAYAALTRHEREGYPWAPGAPGDRGPDGARRVAPPSESPKACPTCGSGWTYHHACPDRGSGIDGGTAA